MGFNTVCSLTIRVHSLNLPTYCKVPHKINWTFVVSLQFLYNIWSFETHHRHMKPENAVLRAF